MIKNKISFRPFLSRQRLFVWLLSVLVFLPLNLKGQDNFYPTDNRLFHIERSKNKNLVCYDVRLTDGKFDTKNPLEVYWIDREKTPGKRKGLTAIQRRMAYGYKLITSDNESAEVTLTAYPGRVLTIRKEHDQYVCLIQINNRQAILQSLYVQANPNNSLQVEYVELHGKDRETGEQLTERVATND
ncbi:hypothetical protein M2480_000761 [Parabacteroides sp. PFB2-12]|uniref:DUF4833 domain-containing protein n=1 Tax=unclassified Parabacteroides TaxID=2649774 RepID=UPI00247570A4|nr:MULTISPECIES: DUF4833 domain-containing protein [unclassified Parabacteroides]MDH6341782.1 hypothetical protein [Parabacteroides sp. PM6-13]MDH6389795.1 hypothetical protein [Parabacteroides sp. PFB2-12]